LKRRIKKSKSAKPSQNELEVIRCKPNRHWEKTVYSEGKKALTVYLNEEWHKEKPEGLCAADLYPSRR